MSEDQEAQQERQSSEANAERRSIQAYEATQEAVFRAQQEVYQRALEGSAKPATREQQLQAEAVQHQAWANKMTHGMSDSRVWTMLESGNTNDAWKWVLYGTGEAV